MHSDNDEDDNHNRELKPFLCPAAITIKKSSSPVASTTPAAVATMPIPFEFEVPRHTIDTILELSISSKQKSSAIMNVSDIMGTPLGVTTGGGASPSQDSNITLWQFLLELLEQKKNSDIIQWILPREKGEFKLIDAEAVAKLWGQRKGKAKMNYDKLSRALRYYYDKGIIKKVVGQKFVYQFPASASVVSSEMRTTPSSNEYHPMKIVKEEKDYDMIMNSYPNFPIPTSISGGGGVGAGTHHGSNGPNGSFSALSLMNTSSPNNTAHSVATPSPSDSACSPSSSSSSASSSAASLMVATTSSMSPMPSTSTSSPHHHDESVTSSSGTSGVSSSANPTNQGQKRKRAESPAANSTPLSVSSTSRSDSKNSEPQPRRMKPNPLNLTATSNFMIPTSTFSPMMLLHQNSPLLQPAINQLYATLASAGLYGPQMSPLFAAASPFRSPMTTPGAATSAAQPQVFQFPPTSSFSATSLINPFSSLISPVAPFMMSQPSNNSFKFPSSDSLKTPTVPLKMPSL